MRHPQGGTSLQLLGTVPDAPRNARRGRIRRGRDGPRPGAAPWGLRAALGRGCGVQDTLWCLWDGTAWPERLRGEALSGSRRAHRDLDAMVELFELAARRAAWLRGIAGARTFAAEISGEEIPADTGRELELGDAGVRLVTAHRAKSLEWERVWVVGVQEGGWPAQTRGGPLLDPDRLDSWEPDTRTNRLLGTPAVLRRVLPGLDAAHRERLRRPRGRRGTPVAFSRRAGGGEGARAWAGPGAP